MDNNRVVMRLFERPEVPHFAHGGLAQAAEAVRQGGRGGDEILLHVNHDEFKKMQDMFGEPSINPDTGLPEYGFFSKLWKGVKKVFKKVAPVLGIAASMFFPALAPAIGGMLGASGTAAAALGNAVIGGVSGAATGGGKGALAGALTGGLGGSAGAIGGKLGLSGAAAKLAGHALIGGAAGKVGGGDFGSGAISGAMGSLLAPQINKSVGALGQAFGLQPANTLSEFDTNQIPDKMAVPSDDPTLGQQVPGQDPGITNLGEPDASLVQQPHFDVPQQGMLERGIDYTKAHPLQVAMGALAVNGMSGNTAPKAPKPPAMPPGWNDPLPQYSFNRHQLIQAPGYYTYGQAPEQLFFSDGTVAPQRAPGMAHGGSTGGQGALSQASRYVNNGTGASGRADNIDAKLSENEYVLDAETVALLGDGNPHAGAKKLDAMRTKLRKHKGAALVKGKFTPPAQDPENYLES